MADHRSREVSSKVDPKGCVHFTYQELSQATNNFDDRPLSRGGCKLGEGGYGPVFKCSLKYTEVAVKGINKRMRVSQNETKLSLANHFPAYILDF